MTNQTTSRQQLTVSQSLNSCGMRPTTIASSGLDTLAGLMLSQMSRSRSRSSGRAWRWRMRVRICSIQAVPLRQGCICRTTLERRNALDYGRPLRRLSSRPSPLRSKRCPSGAPSPTCRHRSRRHPSHHRNRRLRLLHEIQLQQESPLHVVFSSEGTQAPLRNLQRPPPFGYDFLTSNSPPVRLLQLTRRTL